MDSVLSLSKSPLDHESSQNGTSRCASPTGGDIVPRSKGKGRVVEILESGSLETINRNWGSTFSFSLRVNTVLIVKVLRSYIYKKIEKQPYQFLLYVCIIPLIK